MGWVGKRPNSIKGPGHHRFSSSPEDWEETVWAPLLGVYGLSWPMETKNGCFFLGKEWLLVLF
jgi:hypothetical protein